MEQGHQDMELVRNDGQERYELRLNGELAGVADYVMEGGAVALTHTELLPDYRHQGFSSRLARFAVEDIAAQGRQVKPYCSYMARYLQKHPQYSHIVSWPQGAPR